jgi:hypothetical protein
MMTIISLCTGIVCIYKIEGLIAQKLKEKKVEIGKIRILSYMGICCKGCNTNSRGI